MRIQTKIWIGSAVAGAAVLGAMGASAGTDNLTPIPTAVMANFITAGLVDPNGKVPAVNAVPGAGVPNLSIAVPFAILQHGTVYTYLLSSQNVSFNGTCKDSYKLTQGTGAAKVVLDSHVIKSYACTPSSFWEWAINGAPVPNSPGLATLTGTITFGTTQVTTSTTVLIQ